MPCGRARGEQRVFVAGLWLLGPARCLPAGFKVPANKFGVGHLLFVTPLRALRGLAHSGAGNAIVVYWQVIWRWQISTVAQLEALWGVACKAVMLAANKKPSPRQLLEHSVRHII